jgi:hypothetical protein
MSFLTGFKTAPFELFSTTSATTPVNSDASLSTMVGSKFTTGDGREFVLVQNGAVALIAGNVISSPAVVSANFVGLSPATSSTTSYKAAYPIAAAIGGKVIQIASGATAVLANQFMGGYLNVVEGTGLGQTLKIASNLAAATTSALVITVEDPFTTATSTDSRFTLTLNPYGSKNGTYLYSHGVVVVPATTMVGVPIGVTNYPIPATSATVLSYGLIQTKGLCAVAAGATVALGLDVGVPDDTAGQVLTYAVATGSRVGTVVVASADAKHNMINVQL